MSNLTQEYKDGILKSLSERLDAFDTSEDFFVLEQKITGGRTVQSTDGKLVKVGSDKDAIVLIICPYTRNDDALAFKNEFLKLI